MNAAEFTRLGWLEAEYDVVLANGAVRRGMKGFTAGPFGIHEDSSGKWTLTHLNTGARVTTSRTSSEARAIAVELIEHTKGTEAWDVHTVEEALASPRVSAAWRDVVGRCLVQVG